jgi:hypothetical protein
VRFIRAAPGWGPWIERDSSMVTDPGALSKWVSPAGSCGRGRHVLAAPAATLLRRLLICGMELDAENIGRGRDWSHPS